MLSPGVRSAAGAAPGVNSIDLGPIRTAMADERSRPAPGVVVWIEGLPGAGKTTVSRWLADSLHSAGTPTEILDGEEVRRTFFPELGFTRKDRETQARRVSHFAQILARHVPIVLVAMITPYETSRQAARAAVQVPFIEVWLRCPLEICEKRDPQGLYRKTREGTVKRVTGVDDPFEEPLNPDLIVDTGTASATDCGRRVLDHLASKGLVHPVVA